MRSHTYHTFGLALALLFPYAKSSTLTIGVLLSWDESSPSYSASFPGVINLAFDEIDDLNLLPNYDVRWVWHDTHCDDDEAGQAMQDFDEYGVDVVVGPACSESAGEVYEFAEYFDIPLISWAAPSISLSDSDTYPNMVRLLPDYAALAPAIAAFTAELGWANVAVLHSEDARGLHAPTAAAVAEALGAAGVAPAAFAFAEPAPCGGGASAAVEGALSELRAVGHRVVVLVGDCVAQRAALLAARTQAMLAGYAWLLVDMPNPALCAASSSAACGEEDAEEDAAALEALAGALTFAFSSAASGASTSVFLGDVAEANPRFAASLVPPNGTAAHVAGVTAGNPGAHSYALATDAAADALAPFLFDALLTAARALNHTAGLRPAASTSAFLAAARALEFAGKSGPVAFDADSGGRTGAGLSVGVANVVGDGAGGLALVEAARYTGGALALEVGVSTLRWPGGAAEPPTGELASSSAAPSLWTAVLLVAVLSAGCLGVGGALLWRRHRRKQAVYVAHENEVGSFSKDELLQSHVVNDFPSPPDALGGGPMDAGARSAADKTHSPHANGVAAANGGGGGPGPGGGGGKGGRPGGEAGAAGGGGGGGAGAAAATAHDSMGLGQGSSGNLASASMTLTAANGYQAPTEQQRRLLDAEMENLPAETKSVLKEIAIDPREMELGEVIGTGAFAEVRACRYRGSTVAVKALHELSQESIRRFRYEVLLMKDLRHPNIILLIGASWVGNKLMMVVEYMECGSMADALTPNRPEPLNWKDHKLGMVCDVARGMTYLHHARYFNEAANAYETCIIHRDLKPQNLLVTRSYGIKITDFGEARSKNQNATMTAVGTLLYIAPEVVRGDRYDEKCDVYSFAIVMLAALQLKPNIVDVFAETIKQEHLASGGEAKPATYTPMYITTRIVNEHLRPILPDRQIFPSLKILIEQAWSPAPALRPTFDEILEYLETIVKDEVMENKLLDDTPPGTAAAGGGAAGGGGGGGGGAAGGGAAPNASEVARQQAAQMNVAQGPQPNITHSLRLRKRDKNYKPGKGETAREYIAKNKQLAAKMYEDDVQRGAIMEGDEDEEEDEDSDEEERKEAY